MKASELLPYLNKKRAAEMQSLGRELEVAALEVEIHGLDLEIDVETNRLAKDRLEAERAELQTQLEAIKGE